MITDKTLSFATANLFNFIEPPGAFYDFENIYELEAWRTKCLWTQDQLQILDADIIGVQEVFSIEAARILVEKIGYPYFATIDTPHIEQDYIYSQPVVAVASRYPIIRVEAVTPIKTIEESYRVQLPEFSRKPIFAVIDVPDVGEIAIYVCHLKSQRSIESNCQDTCSASVINHSLIGRWLSSQQRGWEAVMLRLFMEHQYTLHPIPTVLMGDMNQPLTSNITGLLTSEPNLKLKGLTLKDSWSIFSEHQPNIERSPTHYHFSKGNVLDYILLSQEFQPDSQYSFADIAAYKVLGEHLTNPIFERDKQASDHAFVATTVRFVL